MPAADQSAQGRGQGRPAILSREKIIAASRRIDADRVSMQAVAAALGVDPTALNYHVGGRKGLLALVAADRMIAAIESAPAAPLGEDVGWEQALRDYAALVRNAVVSVGPLAEHLDMERVGIDPLIAPLERALAALDRAGFDEELSVRAVGAVSHAAAAAGRTAACPAVPPRGRHGSRSAHAGLVDAVEARSAEFPHVARLLSALRTDAAPGPEEPADDGLDEALEVLLAGFAALRDRR
ncbi:TetR/AcrR family transcriptional regulator C-terminal domain-containing protein [Actinomyces sp. B33]|uniref:TetR/AcrR family transcriptional regulator C-terminal domain-containing protein n=1 Tax=Actinomyces sp. B33 TaxID=2942131 RepID=UPI002340BCBD|nr:TetR/AcrR family transcriptional regulator C-terminal domain-containing protein [Actinomyces sp. B33]